MKLPDTLSPSLFSDPAQSPTERFLRSGPSPEAVRAALEGGWLNVSELMVTHPDRRVPALVDCFKDQRFVSHLGLADQGMKWPCEPGDERSVDWGALKGNGEYTTQGLQAEWLVGWCVSQTPPGGLPCWPTHNPHHTSLGFQSHLLGVAVQNRWVSVAEQLLNRSDRLSLDHWNRVVGPNGLNVRTSGQNYAEQLQLPVMHLALETKNNAMLEVLLRAGLDANQVDAFGLPAVYRAKTPESVKLLLKHGLNPHKKPTHGESLLEWWAQGFRSTEEAMRLMTPINQWLSKNEDPEKTRALRLPDVARLLVNGTLTALKKEISQLKVVPAATWEEQGQVWSLARKSLFHHLERSPVIANSSSTLDFGMGRGPLGEPLLAEVPNVTVLWLLSQFNRAARERLEKDFSGTEPSQEEIRALGAALMDWRPPAPVTLSELPKTITKERLEWTLELGAASLFQAKAFENEPFDTHPAPELWAFVRRHTGFVLQEELVVAAIDATLYKAEREREADRLEESGRWVAEALLLLGGLRPEVALGKGSFEEKMAAREEHASLPGIKWVRALDRLQAVRGKVGSQAQIQQIDAWFERINEGALGKALLPYWRQARLEQQLDESAPSSRRPRM